MMCIYLFINKLYIIQFKYNIKFINFVLNCILLLSFVNSFKMIVFLLNIRKFNTKLLSYYYLYVVHLLYYLTYNYCKLKFEVE